MYCVTALRKHTKALPLFSCVRLPVNPSKIFWTYLDSNTAAVAHRSIALLLHSCFWAYVGQYQVKILADYPKPHVICSKNSYCQSQFVIHVENIWHWIIILYPSNIALFGSTSIAMENFLLPNEIVLKIFGYLSPGDLTQCARVFKRFNTICKDKSLSYRLPWIKHCCKMKLFLGS